MSSHSLTALETSSVSIISLSLIRANEHAAMAAGQVGKISFVS